MYIKIGLDLGNNTTCAVSEVDFNYVYKYIPSTYSTPNEFSVNNVINIDSTKIQLGNNTGSELTNIDKTNRLYLKHQILWAVNSLFGHTEHTDFELELAVGLPIVDFSNQEKRSDYENKLNQLKHITGSIDGKEIHVEIKKILVLSEGYSSIKALIEKIPTDNYSTLIIDIGFLTTDVLIVNIEDNKLSVKTAKTINKGISFIYDKIYEDSIRLECLETKSELDYYIKKNHTTLRTTTNTEYNLNEEVMKRVPECTELMNDISNKIGVKTTSYNKLFIGGGSILLFKILGNNWIKNNIDLTNNERYSANAKGYYLSL